MRPYGDPQYPRPRWEAPEGGLSGWFCTRPWWVYLILAALVYPALFLIAEIGGF